MGYSGTGFCVDENVLFDIYLQGRRNPRETNKDDIFLSKPGFCLERKTRTSNSISCTR